MNSIFKKLYSMVGQKYSKSKLKTRKFTDFSWTVEEQFLFRNWLLNKIDNNVKVKNELAMFIECSNNSETDFLVNEFILDYGWHIKFDMSEINELYLRGCYVD